MNGVTILMLFVIGCLIILAGVTFGVYFFTRKLSTRKSLRLLALLPALTLGYFVFGAIYPDDDFYKEDFKEITGFEFPIDSEIIYKSASYPDQFGDYGSVSVVELNSKTYQGLLTQLPSNGFVSTKECTSPYLEKALQKIESKQIEKEYCLELEGKAFYVGLLSDAKTVIASRQSW